MSIRVDFHVHTHYSADSQTSIRTLIRTAKRRGIGAIAITDHDTVAGIAEAEAVGRRYGVMIIPGIEVTAADGTHVLGLGIHTVPRSRGLREVITEIHQLGGLVCLPHLQRRDTGLLANWQANHQWRDEEVEEILRSVDLIEIISQKSVLEGDAFYFDVVKRIGKPVVAGTDAHYPFEVGIAYAEMDGVTPGAIARGASHITFREVPDRQPSRPALSHQPGPFYRWGQRYARWLEHSLPFLLPGLRRCYRWLAYRQAHQRHRRLLTTMKQKTISTTTS